MAGALSAGQQSVHSPARLLLVDEELHVCAVLTRALETMGYCVESVTSAERALTMLESQPFDVMILDPAMPGINGQDMMCQLRCRYPEMVMIVLTREASVEGAIAAVKCGATDYLVKPDGLHGLTDAVIEALQRRTEQIRRHATLRAVGEIIATLQKGEPPPCPLPLAETGDYRNNRGLRRNRGLPLATTGGVVEAKTPYTCHRAPVYLDYQHQLVMVEGDLRQQHCLTRNETTILHALMTHAGETVSCQYLAAALSDGEGDEEHMPGVVRNYVHRLRRKIEANPDRPRVIRTVRGKGYLFAEA